MNEPITCPRCACVAYTVYVKALDPSRPWSAFVVEGRDTSLFTLADEPPTCYRCGHPIAASWADVPQLYR